jgi:hypothetical protein
MRLSSAMATTYSGASKTAMASEGVGELGARVARGSTASLLSVGGCWGWPARGQGTMDARHGSSAPVTGGGRICEVGWADYCC